MKFSVIMPTYNCEKYVKTAIDSVLSQTYSDFELIIVDDGSEDNTYQICSQFSDSTKVFVYKKEHNGVSAARNYGISKAKGEYILFIDCDDTWHPDLLKICDESISVDDNMILFGIKSDFYSNDGVFKYSSNDFDEKKEDSVISLDNGSDEIFARYNFASPCNKLFRKKIIESNGIAFSPECVYLEDLKFNLDYLKNIKNVKVVHKNLYNYRLLIDKKQILKRKFKRPFGNADELFNSVELFLQHNNISLNKANILSNLTMHVYMSEFFYWSQQSSKMGCISQLNKNEKYNKLLKNINGNFFAILRLAKTFRLKIIQIKLIERRY